MNGLSNDFDTMENVEILRVSSQTVLNDHNANSGVAATPALPFELPSDATMKSLAKQTPESTQSWHKELLFGLFLHSSDGELSEIAKMANSKPSLSSSLPTQTNSLEKSNNNDKETSETITASMFASDSAHTEMTRSDATNKQQQASSLLRNNDLQNESHTRTLSLIPHVLHEAAQASMISQSTDPSQGVTRRVNGQYMSVETVEKLEDIVEKKFQKSAIIAKQANNCFTPFSLEYNQVSMTAIASWAMQQRPDQYVPVPSVLFSKCTCCQSWGHYETECKQRSDKDTINVSRLVTMQQEMQPEEGRKSQRTSVAKQGDSVAYESSNDSLDDYDDDVSSTIDLEGCDGFVVEQCKRKQCPDSTDNDVEWAFSSHGWSTAVGFPCKRARQHQNDPSPNDAWTPGDWTRFKNSYDDAAMLEEGGSLSNSELYEESWEDADDAVQDGFLIRARRHPLVDQNTAGATSTGRLVGSIVAWFPKTLGNETGDSTLSEMLVGIVQAANLGDGTALVQPIRNWKTLLSKLSQQQCEDGSFVVNSCMIGASTWFHMADLHVVSSGAPLAIQRRFSNGVLPKALEEERERLERNFVAPRSAVASSETVEATDESSTTSSAGKDLKMPPSLTVDALGQDESAHINGVQNMAECSSVEAQEPVESHDSQDANGIASAAPEMPALRKKQGSPNASSIATIAQKAVTELYGDEARIPNRRDSVNSGSNVTALPTRDINNRAWRGERMPSNETMRRLLHVSGEDWSNTSQTDKAITTRFKRHFHPNDVAYCSETDDWRLVDEPDNSRKETEAPEALDGRNTTEEEATTESRGKFKKNDVEDSATGELQKPRPARILNEMAWNRVEIEDIPTTEWMSTLLKAFTEDEEEKSQKESAIRMRFRRKLHPENVLRWDGRYEWKLATTTKNGHVDNPSSDSDVAGYRQLRWVPGKDPKEVNEVSDMAVGPAKRAKMRRERKVDDETGPPAESNPGNKSLKTTNEFDPHTESSPQLRLPESVPMTPTTLRSQPSQLFSSDVFQVEAILDDRQVTVAGGKKTTEYKIKWHGYGMDDCTWEPKDNIWDPCLVEKYEVHKAYKVLTECLDESKRCATSKLVIDALAVGKQVLDELVSAGISPTKKRPAVTHRMCPFCRTTFDSIRSKSYLSNHLSTHSSAKNFGNLKEAALMIRAEWYDSL